MANAAALAGLAGLAGLAALAVSVLLLVLCILPGSPGENRYGPPRSAATMASLPTAGATDRERGP